MLLISHCFVRVKFARHSRFVCVLRIAKYYSESVIMTELLPNWMKRFLQQDLDEEKKDVGTPVKLLIPTARSFIWWLCKQYDLMSDGVMGQTCSLFERYMSKKIRTFSHLSRRSSEWRQFKKEMGYRIPLLASVCIALTSKMMSSERQLHAKAIKSLLLSLGISTSLRIINNAEMDVLSTVGFCIPMFTNVEKALMMAVDVGMTGRLLEGVSLVTEVAEYYRAEIQDEVISVAFTMGADHSIRRRDIANVRHIHLAAGCVIATGLFLMHRGPDPVQRLSFLTQCSAVYVKCIGNLIHRRLIADCGEPCKEPPSKKRKLAEH